jgi:hypothetical protein
MQHHPRAAVPPMPPPAGLEAWEGDAPLRLSLPSPWAEGTRVYNALYNDTAVTVGPGGLLAVDLTNATDAKLYTLHDLYPPGPAGGARVISVDSTVGGGGRLSEWGRQPWRSLDGQGPVCLDPA